MFSKKTNFFVPKIFYRRDGKELFVSIEESGENSLPKLRKGSLITVCQNGVNGAKFVKKSAKTSATWGYEIKKQLP